MEEEKICNHSHPSVDSNSTLKKLPTRRLSHPEIQDFYCPVCHECFRYIVDNESVHLLPNKKERE